MLQAADCSPQPTRTSPVALADGSITIRDEASFGPDGGEPCARFLSRAFAVVEVRSAMVDRSMRTVTLRVDASGPAMMDVLSKLAASLRQPAEPVLWPALTSARRFSLHRHGATLTTWQVVIDQPGRLKLRQDALRHEPVVVDRVVRELAKLPGVRVARASERTGYLLIRYDPASISSRALLGRAESTLFELQGANGRASAGVLSSFRVANLSLAVAAVGEVLLPALLPASAILLVATNARTIRAAFRQLLEGRLGLPVLYIAIIATTLATGQFLASALMTWAFLFWDRRFRVELASERNRLLEHGRGEPLMAKLLVPSGAEVLVTVARLKVGDRLVVAKGDLVPADGVVITGEGMVDERDVRGMQAISRRRQGDALLAGSTVLAGGFQVEVSRLGERTRAASIRRALVAATSPAPGQSALTNRSERFASRAVGPTLATAGVGLLAGDLMAVGAILRPDYATGPGLAVPLETLHKVALCARSGIVVRDPEALERLAEVELFVLHDHPALHKLALEVAKVETILPEGIALRYAASAFRHLDDDRSAALAEACRERGVHLLDLEAVEFGRGVTVAHERHRVRVGDVDPDAGSAGALAIEVDGQPMGRIEFVASDHLEAASSVERVRRGSHVPFALVSSAPAAEVSKLAGSLGVEMFRGDFTQDDTAEFLAACRSRGLKVAFVGDCRLHPLAASRAHVAVSLVDAAELAGELDLDEDKGSFLMQRAGLAPLVELSRVARDHASRVVQAEQLILVPNLLCIAGAFLFGFTGMTAVMLSNLGTLGLYRLASDSLRGLDSPSTSHRPGRPRRAG